MPVLSCPSCAKKLNIPDTLVGKKVKCSACQTVFVAEDDAPPPPPPRPSQHDAEPKPRKSVRVSRDADDDQEPEEKPRKQRRFEDDEDDRPRRRRDLEPHRGALVLTFGIIGFFFLPLAIAAWVIGNGDLKRIRAGRMDPSGEGQTSAGRICGMIATILSIVSCCMVGAFYILMFGAMAAGAR